MKGNNITVCPFVVQESYISNTYIRTYIHVIEDIICNVEATYSNPPGTPSPHYTRKWSPADSSTWTISAASKAVEKPSTHTDSAMVYTRPCTISGKTTLGALSRRSLSSPSKQCGGRSEAVAQGRFQRPFYEAYKATFNTIVLQGPKKPPSLHLHSFINALTNSKFK